MKKFVSLFLLSGIFFACNNSSSNENSETEEITPVAAANSLSETESADGWKLLFNGTDKSGWHIYNNGSDGADWLADDGTLHCNPSKSEEGQPSHGGDLVTNDEYENFDLKLDWKIDTAGNSGILFNVNEDPKYENTYHTGPEMQVLDNERHPDGKIIKHRAGDLYDLITSSPETVKPAGEWNAVEIISNNGHLEFHLNGSKVVETTMWDDNWKNMVANSKFKEWPDFGTFKKGRIALQDHGNKVWYRNIKIKTL